jgi:hypothetical protein
MNVLIQLRCCICGDVVDRNDRDGYSLQVRKFGNNSPGMIWAHGSCLRRVIPVVRVRNYRAPKVMLGDRSIYAYDADERNYDAA